MPRKNVILNLPGFAHKKVSGINPIVLDVYYRRKARCVFCHRSKLRKKSHFMRLVKYESFGYRQSILHFKKKSGQVPLFIFEKLDCLKKVCSAEVNDQMCLIHENIFNPPSSAIGTFSRKREKEKNIMHNWITTK